MGYKPLSVEQIASAVGCSLAVAEKYAPHLDETFRTFDITSFKRLCAFFAQVGHESLSFRYTSELWGPTAAQSRYEGRKDLGNTQPGDGSKFRGHGLIQQTGRYNHARVRDNLRKRFPDAPDFEVDPLALCQPRWAALSAGDYWADKSLNALADSGQFELITRKINGGLNGQPDRLLRWEKAKKALFELESAEAEKEPVVIPALLAGLAASLVENFVVPLAKEKTSEFFEKNKMDSTVADTVASAMIDTAVAATGITDPIAAVVAAKADPVVMEKVQTAAVESIDKMAPLLDRLAAIDREQWEAEEASRDAASRRAATDGNDQDVFLTRAIVSMMLGLMCSVAILIAVLAYFKADNTLVAGLAALFTTLAGGIAGKFSTRYDHRYGSSRGSSAKDVVINELSKR